MKRILSLILLLFVIGCNDDEKDKAKSKEELLAGATSRTWKLVSASDDDEAEHPTCKASAPRNADNKFIFFKDGEFEFDRGTVTDEDLCNDVSEGPCCSDLLNLYGTWSFTNNKTFLKVTAEGLIENGTKVPSDDTEVLVDSQITTLSETELKLIDGGVTYTFVPFN